MSLSEHASEELHQILKLVSETYELKFNSIVRIPVYSDWKASLQNNKDLHILFVWGGEGAYHMHDGTVIPLMPGTLVFISYGVEHHAYIEPGKCLRIAGLRFRLCDESGADVTNRLIVPFYSYFHSENLQHYNDLTWKIHQLYYKNKDSVSQTMCAALLYELIYEFYESVSGGIVKDSPGTRMEKVKRMIEEHPFEKLSISEMAKEAGISTRYLQKRFKENYRFTPKEYHLQIQMNMALTMLEQESRSVSAVAERLGYSDAFTFSKQFKKYFGYSPSKTVRI